MIKNKKVYIVGAGSGDPELITLKAYNLILNADYILYDALVNKSILNFNSFAKKIFVGKRKGFQIMSQEKINRLIVNFFYIGKKVLRLKGGDPMVFGRVHEEILFLKNHGIDCDIIPGISSYSGISAYNKIPITKRNEIDSFIVTTGFTNQGKISKDFKLFCKSNATIIILMGISNLEKLIFELKKYKSSNYPIAIIQNGTTKLEKSIIGTIENIVELVQNFKISNPANIIIGYAVNDAIVKLKNLKNIIL